MQEINERFKDVHPEQTVENIRYVLKKVGIEVEEIWNESGLRNCHSLHIRVKGAQPFRSNGKGVTKALARASAYGEFIERLQCGLFLYKFQSVTRDPAMNLQMYAPDGKYMTMQELVEAGDWMEPIIATYGGGLTRQKLAQQCQIYACTKEDKIWTLPYYSLFEDKYVYLPAGLVEHVYSANGCCAGNTREEAWVHALSEILERRCAIRLLLSGKAVPQIPDEVLANYPMAVEILEKIRQEGNFDVQMLDASLGTGFPVVSTRIINKQTHGYIVNFAADPILEIALDRSLTEIFQGRNIQTFGSTHNGLLRDEQKSIPVAHNVLNQVENNNGVFALDFFAEELTCNETCTDFPDHTGKSNKELLEYTLELYRNMGRQVYVRNCSFLGFPSYQLVVPGFSETRGYRLVEPMSEYALGDAVVDVYRNAEAASNAQLQMMLMFHNKIQTAFSRRRNFCGVAGLPLDVKERSRLLAITLSYAAYRLNQYALAIKHLEPLLSLKTAEESEKDYYRCVSRYLQMKLSQLPDEKIRLVLEKFYHKDCVLKLYELLQAGKTPYDAQLLRCDCSSCATCRYADCCSYQATAQLLFDVGQVYKTFTDGQAKSNFTR